MKFSEALRGSYQTLQDVNIGTNDRCAKYSESRRECENIFVLYIIEWKVFTIVKWRRERCSTRRGVSSLLPRKNFQKRNYASVIMQALRRDVLKSEGVYLWFGITQPELPQKAGSRQCDHLPKIYRNKNIYIYNIIFLIYIEISLDPLVVH